MDRESIVTLFHSTNPFVLSHGFFCSLYDSGLAVPFHDYFLFTRLDSTPTLMILRSYIPAFQFLVDYPRPIQSIPFKDPFFPFFHPSSLRCPTPSPSTRPPFVSSASTNLLTGLLSIMLRTFFGTKLRPSYKQYVRT